MTHIEAAKTLASERYLLGEMSELERHAFEDHFFSCSECAEDMRIGSRMRDGAEAGFASVRVAPVRARWSVPAFAPWAMAATLAGIAAYQSMWVLPELKRQTEPQALAPIALRGATRGADTVVKIQDSHPLTLAVDVNVADSAPELSYALRNSQGATVAFGRAPSPPAGTPLLLMFPSTTFPTPGLYILRLSDAASGSGSVGEYRFVVEAP